MMDVTRCLLQDIVAVLEHMEAVALHLLKKMMSNVAKVSSNVPTGGPVHAETFAR